MDTIDTRIPTIISGGEILTRNWYAWNNLIPPKPHHFYLVGEIHVPNPGVVAILCPREPQGINLAIYLLDLFLVQQAGIWPQHVTWADAKYEKIIVGKLYGKATVFFGGKEIASVPVEDVH